MYGATNIVKDIDKKGMCIAAMEKEKGVKDACGFYKGFPGMLLYLRLIIVDHLMLAILK